MCPVVAPISLSRALRHYQVPDTLEYPRTSKIYYGIRNLPINASGQLDRAEATGWISSGAGKFNAYALVRATNEGRVAADKYYIWFCQHTDTPPTFDEEVEVVWFEHWSFFDVTPVGFDIASHRGVNRNGGNVSYTADWKVWRMSRGYDAAYAWNNPPPRIDEAGTLLRQTNVTTAITPVGESTYARISFSRSFYNRNIKRTPHIRPSSALRFTIPAGTQCAGLEIGSVLDYTLAGAANQFAFAEEYEDWPFFVSAASAKNMWDRPSEGRSIIFKRAGESEGWNGEDSDDYWATHVYQEN